MPTVAELTDLYANFMLNPRPGAGVCETCFTFTDLSPVLFYFLENGSDGGQTRE